VSVMALVLGGFIGTLLRYGIGEALPPLDNGFPLGTLLINLSGCLFLGWFFAWASRRASLKTEVRLGLGTGLTGAYTTFSAFSVQIMDMLGNGQVVSGVAYLLASVVGGIGLTFAGVRLAGERNRRKPDEVVS
jgi:fluoride exporter